MKRLGLFVLLTLSASQAIAADKDITDEFEKAAASATDETYQLQYKFKKGESYTYRVEQIATVDTTIDGNNQKTQLRSGSVRSLKVVDVDDSGNMTFEHVIDEVDMWSEVTGRQAVKYNSTTDKEAPPEFERVKDSVGTPISTITMAPNGIVVKREDKTQQPNLGMGGLSIPLPDGPVRPGHTWTNPLEIKVRLENQQIKSIKTREHYTLEKVSAGVATIKIST
ncbi:MAG: hypothetical protein KDB27_34445, partial [Planctomycetales bacterium]|nr:hypothetical protein [Planctomycetales bacterium]